MKKTQGCQSNNCYHKDLLVSAFENRWSQLFIEELLIEGLMRKDYYKSNVQRCRRRRGKDPAFVDQEDLDDEERVGYETDTYFFDPNDTSFEGDIDDEVQPEAGMEATLVTIPTKGEPNWLLRIELDNIILEQEATINKTKAIIAEAQVRMETAQEQMKELEIKSFELIMERALKASQLQAEEARLEVVKVHVIPTDLEVLKERALKSALDARDAELATHIEHIKSLSHQ
ncbi:uncharacterized protein A4U43_C08F15890 [Asparagus officinalis]|nr:uncharacterized protein A4U43_C08F15890 [Asparagus officinalis]